jgi:glycopeptide antibiotics resistance protein
MVWQLVTIYLTGMRHVLHGLLLILAVCVPLVLGTYFYTRALDTHAARRRAARAALLTLFAFYCAALAGALVFSRVDLAHFAASRAEYMENFDLMTNFVPFETVRLYLNAIKYDYIGMEIPLSNLVGNAMLFMPMAVFLPCLFRPMRRLWLFALTMALVLVTVEALQLLLACGSCDVDDVLLNLAGTLIVFGILKIPPVKRLLIKMRLMQDEPEPEKPEEPVKAESAASQPRL